MAWVDRGSECQGKEPLNAVHLRLTAGGLRGEGSLNV